MDITEGKRRISCCFFLHKELFYAPRLSLPDFLHSEKAALLCDFSTSPVYKGVDE